MRAVVSCSGASRGPAFPLPTAPSVAVELLRFFGLGTVFERVFTGGGHQDEGRHSWQGEDADVLKVLYCRSCVVWW